MKYLFAAGGTGGHINPALAVAGYIREQEPDAEILFVGTADKMEAKLVPAAGFAFETIEISGFQRKPSLENLKRNLLTVKRMFTASAASKRIIRAFAPDVAIGFGGYVSGPVIRQAHKLGVKTAIHEQNAFPGMANKTLAKSVDRVMLTVDAARSYLQPKNEPVVTGLPVRGEILHANRDLARFELKLDDRPMILSLGGSLGARSINEAVTELIAAHHKQAPYTHIHAMGQYGLWMPERLREKGVDVEHAPHLDIREYIHDMDRCMAAADLVICRSGASTLSELEALGKPSVLIPSPNVAENHQYHNAMTLVNAGAAVLIAEKDLTGGKLTAVVDELMADAGRLRQMGERAGALAVTDAKARIYEVIQSLANAPK